MIESMKFWMAKKLVDFGFDLLISGILILGIFALFYFANKPRPRK